MERLTLELVGHPSVTGTPGEAAFADVLARILRRLPYFQAHPAEVQFFDIAGDPLRRRSVFALVRGQGRATVLLSGHYDTVSAENYGTLAPLAHHPDALRDALLLELAEGELALADLRSGDFLPGRGVLDMKSGLACALAVLARFAAQPQRRGNLALLATPDEEGLSSGMRDAAARLLEQAARRGLRYTLNLNLDATSDQGDGSAGQALYLGSVGKLLASVLIVGRDTHAGYPFDGVNPHWLASFVTQRLECNPDLCDEAAGEVAPPPTLLSQGDFKTRYDVTTPGTVWATVNVLTHRKKAAQVLAELKREVAAALADALSELRRRAQRSAGLSSQAPSGAPLVLSFAELEAQVRARGGAALHAACAAHAARLEADETLDAPTRCRLQTAFAWRAAGLSGPAAVVGFASLHYPSVLLDPTDPGAARVREKLAGVLGAAAADHGVRVSVRNFFAGISDMSWLGPHDTHDLSCVSANTPSAAVRLSDPSHPSSQRSPGLPTVNLGPWGRDYHQRLERVYTPYSFGVLPELLWRVSGAFLEEG